MATNPSLLVVAHDFTLRLSKLLNFALRHCQNFSLFCIPSFLKTVPFNKFYSINIDDKRNDCFFIKPHTSLTPLPEAIGLYVIFDRPYMQLDHLSFHYILLVLYY